MPENAYNQSNLIGILRNKGISRSDIDDDALLGIIDEALHDYLFRKPKVCITAYAESITTVNDQPNYDLPEGALWIKDVFWHPGYAATDYEDIWTEIMASGLHAPNPTVMLIDYQKMSQLNRFSKGFWEIRNDEIWLKPCPDGVYNVAVLYAGSRTLEEMDQIADRRFADLCYYHALLAVGTKKLTGGGWRAGQFAVNEAVGKETMKVAREGLKETRLAINNSYRMSRS